MQGFQVNKISKQVAKTLLYVGVMLLLTVVLGFIITNGHALIIFIAGFFAPPMCATITACWWRWL